MVIPFPSGADLEEDDAVLVARVSWLIEAPVKEVHSATIDPPPRPLAVSIGRANPNMDQAATHGFQAGCQGRLICGIANDRKLLPERSACGLRTLECQKLRGHHAVS